MTGVYLSAPGLICCAGNNRERFFAAALAGDQGGIREITLSGGRRFLAGRIPHEFLYAPGEGTDPQRSRLLRIIDAALEQIRAEIEGALSRYGPRRVGVCVGSCDNGTEWSVPAHRAYFTDGAFPPSYELCLQGAGYPAAYISRNFGLAGPSLAVSTACASGAGALIKGAELIQAGICDAVIAGGADIASETVLLGFDSLGAVSPGICKPFSKNRDGITLGEGAAFFLLSGEAVPSGEGFPRRGIRLLGAGESADAFHMTAPREDGAGAAAAMEKALAAGGIKPGEVGYVNAHGTGTPLNDRMEAHALASVFFKAGPGPLVSSTKPITGHTLGAAGALELALCWMALVYSQAPPHCWDGVYDEELPRLHFAARRGGPPEPDPETPARDNLKVCMSNSFAFGGCNTSLIIGKGED